jgi:hypothetical protein
MSTRRENLTALGLMLALLYALTIVWFPYIPNEVGRVSVDYSLWLPDMLAGYYWYLQNGLLAVPWFSPSQCAGIPFHADPQVAWFAVPQFLTFIMPPLAAAKTNFLLFAAAGYWGAWHLARRTFALSFPAALFTAALFMLNGFFSVRMVVGHLTYAPFMLLPALAACVLRPPALPPCLWPETVLRTTLAGLLIALCVQAGMVHIIPPLYLSLVVLMLIHAMRCGHQRTAWTVLTAATLLGLALSAGKLAASLSLLSNFPRDTYPLPGIKTIPAVLYVIFRSLFTPVSDALGHLVFNSRLIQEQHEFEYGVSAAPLLLMLAAAWQAARQGWRPTPTRTTLALAALLLIPVALNLYIPAWNALLKSLPFFGSSSTLMRWCAAYILPAIIGGALALDSLARGQHVRANTLAGAGIALMLATVALSNHDKYGPNLLGFYNEDALEAAWHKAHDTGTIQPIGAITTLRDDNNQLSMAPERQNGLTQGFSTLFCYEPLFGYHLERFPFGKIRLGDALDPRDGALNLKNPACYVFPGANQCHPGDPFPASRLTDAQAFLNYHPFPFAKPAYAVAADWLNLGALFAVPFAIGWGAWETRRKARGSAPRTPLGPAAPDPH